MCLENLKASKLNVLGFKNVNIILLLLVENLGCKHLGCIDDQIFWLTKSPIFTFFEINLPSMFGLPQIISQDLTGLKK